MLIEINLQPLFPKFDFLDWKVERLLNYQCDKVVTFYKTIIKDLFVLYSKKKTVSASKPFVSLEELMVLS